MGNEQNLSGVVVLRCTAGVKVCADVISFLYSQRSAANLSVSNSSLGGSGQCERRKRPQARAGHLVGGEPSNAPLLQELCYSTVLSRPSPIIIYICCAVY